MFFRTAWNNPTPHVGTPRVAMCLVPAVERGIGRPRSKDLPPCHYTMWLTIHLDQSRQVGSDTSMSDAESIVISDAASEEVAGYPTIPQKRKYAHVSHLQPGRTPRAIQHGPPAFVLSPLSSVLQLGISHKVVLRQSSLSVSPKTAGSSILSLGGKSNEV
ncbi:MAG: hypothetical protein OHK93_002460 [Ramalina farinacea]|uniref:Uncharacterized protein n=1 Tax=Ramalina farinacea TaxID=258253 RepID=A0AA43U0D8_9LECA|nr:hypothetical protein [Ramalina farinacea]